MKVKVTCSCNTSFDLDPDSVSLEEVTCPNCGKSLPKDTVKEIVSTASRLNAAESE